MKNPLVSIIIPCFNVTEFIEESVQSALNQDYSNIEIIIVDDGSTEDVHSVVKQFLTESVSFFKKENGGLASARNFGIDKSNGELILPLDSDDKIHETYVSKAVNIFTQRSEVSLVYSKAALFGAEKGEWKMGDYSFKHLLLDNMIFCSAIFKKEKFLNVGKYNEKFRFGREDWDLWLRYLDEESIVIKIPEELFFYRKHSGNSMSDQFSNALENNVNLFDLFYFNRKLYARHFDNPITQLHRNKELEIKYQKLQLKYLSLKKSFYERLKEKIKSFIK
ncbi:glycosyltransferase [Urechidicola vernalis]|uniref:Glycosyltransferase n=1 Tax=Urechidicola vernalis TaxID=3075600 RepID=A0ABU2Y3J3_9FLAO|nr:glycosyltransferase [Urechidicola sp. P050]MDT0552272.1 glycosyltransferase [Urechidicola sp. P050]